MNQPTTLSQASQALTAPVELDEALLKLVAGGSPKGTWTDSTSSPKGTWASSPQGAWELGSPKGTW